MALGRACSMGVSEFHGADARVGALGTCHQYNGAGVQGWTGGRGKRVVQRAWMFRPES